VIGFLLAALHDELKNELAPLFIQSEVKPKSIVSHSHVFSHALFLNDMSDGYLSWIDNTSSPN